MERFRLALLSEIALQARFSLLAYRDAVSELAARDEERFWYSVQAMLSAAARLSGLLWPADSALRDAAAALRAALEVPDASPLAPAAGILGPDPLLDLARWLGSGSKGKWLPSNVSANGVLPPGAVPCLRSVDPATSIVTLFGAPFDLQALMTAVGEVWAKASAESGKSRSVM